MLAQFLCRRQEAAKSPKRLIFAARHEKGISPCLVEQHLNDVNLDMLVVRNYGRSALKPKIFLVISCPLASFV